MREGKKKINWVATIFLCTIVFQSWFYYGFEYSQVVTFAFETDFLDPYSNFYCVQSISLIRPEPSNNEYYPAVILLHGDDTFAYSMNLLKLEFLRNGYIVITMNIVKYNPAIFYVLNKTVNYLLSQTYINSKQIGIVGHSHGANYALLFSSFRSNAIHGVVALNFGPFQTMLNDYYPYFKNFVVKGKNLPDTYSEFIQKNDTLSLPMNFTTPNNVLLIDDEFDPHITVNPDLYLYHYTEGRYNKSDEMFGNFYSGTARELIIQKSLLGHVSGIFSSDGIYYTVDWMNKALGVTGYEHNYLYAFYVSSVAIIGFLTFVVSGLILIERRYRIVHYLIERHRQREEDKRKYGKDFFKYY